MTNGLGRAANHSELIAVIRQVRRRWRIKLALRGVVTVLAAGLLALVASSYGLEFLKFSPPSVITFRILTSLVILSLVGYFLVRPMLRRVSDEQVALYLEEHEPSLEAAIVSAVETGTRTAGSGSESPALVRRLVETAFELCQAVNAGRGVDGPHLKRHVASLAGVVLAASALFMLGPPYLRHGISALLLISQSVEAASPYHIEVSPGNVSVPRGSDQTITARLVGFDTEQAELAMRKAPGTSFERIPLVRGETGVFEGMLFDLAGSLDYFVQAGGVQSPLYNFKVVDLPYVQRLDLEYRFPAYTGLTPRKIENGGDIAVIRGTEVHLRAFLTMAAPGGSVLLDDREVVALKREADGTMTGNFTVQRSGFYRVELNDTHGAKVSASPQYTIDVLADQDPSVSFSKPGRDTHATPLEEVFVEARAEDDFGVRELQLVYSVNGGPETTLKLYGGGNKPLQEVTAGHTFYLEELGLTPGDFVSYYARAFDNDQVQGRKSVTSDLYFVQIQTFNKDFKPAQSMAGGMGGGGGGGNVQAGALSQQQREIIAATFNVIRDKKTYKPDKFRENVVVITLSQGRLREQVEGLVGRMNSELVEPDPAFQKIAELLPNAVSAMREAETKLQAQTPEKALQAEQRALQQLQKAEEEYELQVNVSRGQGGGGGGGGAGSIAEDLADLFELELDKLANQYEMTERAEQQSADAQVDEMAERLKELARRQEQEAERSRRRAALAGQSGQGGGGAGQRELAQQAEEAARRLEKLSREQERPELMDAARRLQEAADAMRRAAASGDQNAAGQASAALEQLREAQRGLQRGQTARGERDVQDALRKAEQLQRQQSEIAGDVNSLGKTTEGREERIERLMERKDALESNVAELERQLDRAANDMRGSERIASRKVEEAAGLIRDKKVKEKIRYSKGINYDQSPDYAGTFEQSIGSDLDALRKKLGEAADAIGRDGGDRMTDALDKTRDLARGLESLDQRMRERGGQQDANAQRGNGQAGGQQSGSDQTGGQQSDGRNADGQQGGGAQNGGRNADGQQGGGAQNGPGSRQYGPGGGGDRWGGGAYGPGNWNDTRPWGYRYGYTRDDIRQWRGEIRRWTADANGLRQWLRGQGVDVGDLDEVIRGLRLLDDERVYEDGAELERLQASVSEGMKRFEYRLRRQVETDNGQTLLAGSDDVPRGFRQLVEEYYRALSRKRAK